MGPPFLRLGTSLLYSQALDLFQSSPHELPMIRYALSATAALSTLSATGLATAQNGETKIYARSGSWVIHQQPKFCEINAQLPEGGQLSFAKASRGDAYLRYKIAGDNSAPYFAANAPKVEWDFDQTRFSGQHFGMGEYGPQPDGEAIEAAFRNARQLTIRRNGEILAQISLAGSAKAIAVLNRCAGQWPDGFVPVIPPAPAMPVRTVPHVPEPDLKGPFPPNRTVMPIDPGRWVTPRDYPAMALRNEVEGVSRFTASVGADGRVKQCDITQSSGDVLLDQKTCTLVIQRARFNPATDAEAALIESSWSSAVRWEIPRRAPSPLPVPPVPADRSDTHADGDPANQEGAGEPQERTI